jgi:cellulase
MIALHGAGSRNGAQFYMECAQIEVTGGVPGSKKPETVSIPGVYKATDPGIMVNIYPNPKEYATPGSTQFFC